MAKIVPIQFLPGTLESNLDALAEYLRSAAVLGVGLRLTFLPESPGRPEGFDVETVFVGEDSDAPRRRRRTKEEIAAARARGEPVPGRRPKTAPTAPVTTEHPTGG